MKTLSVILTAILLFGALAILGCAPKPEPLPSGTTYNNSVNPSSARKVPAGGGGMKAD
jgi:hypothetical protein